MKSLLVTLALLLCAVRLFAIVPTKYNTNDSDNTATVAQDPDLQYDRIEELTIPSEVTIDGKTYTVVGIDKNAFKGSTIYNITLPETLKSIGDLAFSGTTIPYLYIPDGVENIGVGAFQQFRCNAIHIPDSLKEVDSNWYTFAFSKVSEFIEFASDSTKLKFINRFHIGNQELTELQELIQVNENSVVKKLANESLEEAKKRKEEAQPEKKKEELPGVYANKVPFVVEKEYGKFYWKTNSAGKKYLVNEAGKTILPATAWDSVWLDNIIVIKKNGKIGAYSYNGTKLVSAVYNSFQGYGAEGRLLFANNTPNGMKLFVFSKKGALLASKAFTNSQKYSAAAWIKDWMNIVSPFEIH